MSPILWIALYLTAWSVLAVWTVVKAGRTGRRFDPRSPGYAFTPQRRTSEDPALAPRARSV